MTRFVSIVIVMWGLLVQPLMAAAMPTKIMGDSDSTHSPMVAGVDISVHADGHHDNSSLTMKDSSKTTCHEESPDESSSVRCDNCNDSCSSGPCASSCATGSSPAAFQKLSANLALNGNTLVVTTTGARIDGLPSRIFHPPKHS